VSAALWRAARFKWEKRYDDALRTLDASRSEVFSQCGYLWKRAEILCRMGRFAEAIETLRKAPFGEEIDTFPAMVYEAIFLYCYLLQRSGRDPRAP
jgi:tetratricopeptide (TPR) repeat protein